MKARPKKPGARGTAAKRPAAARHAAVARKARNTARPANRAAKPAMRAKPHALASSVGQTKHSPANSAGMAKHGASAKSANAAASQPSRTTLRAECTIEHAPGLQKLLAKVLDDRACVTLDFSAVKRCDTAGMQVLAAFIRERREAGRDVELASMSENFLATVKLLGLNALFTGAEAGA